MTSAENTTASNPQASQPVQFRIGSVFFDSPVLLAPMAGYTDLPFRNLVRRNQGLGLGYTEMIRPGGLILGREKKTQKILATCPSDSPLGWQIYGREPELMAEAAKWLEDHGARLIDLNMGCPQKKISYRGAGAGLLKTPDLAVEIARKVTASVGIPVTAKIRLGWDSSRIVGPDLAKRLVDAGISALTVHGRTAVQGYGGQADWDCIGKIAASLKGFPVVGNGDISSVETGVQRLRTSGCSAIMVGRAALKNPWLIRDISRAAAGQEPLPRPEKKDVLNLVLNHFDEHSALYGFEKAGVLYRKWIPLYVRSMLKMEKPEMVRLLTIAGSRELRDALASQPVQAF